MEPEVNPLETRSLPGALWEHFPRAWAEQDEALRAWFASHIDGSASPWREIRWLTENDLGIAIVAFLFAAVFIYLKVKQSKVNGERQLFVKKELGRLLLFATLAGFSNLVSVAIKRGVGRLKPHVNWWDKAAPLPALSFPSSHAFNTAFLLTLVFFLQDAESRRRWGPYLAVLTFFTFTVGVSRIIFTQHYPLDVIAGWVLGFGLACLLRRPLQKFFKSWRL